MMTKSRIFLIRVLSTILFYHSMLCIHTIFFSAIFLLWQIIKESSEFSSQILSSFCPFIQGELLHMFPPLAFCCQSINHFLVNPKKLLTELQADYTLLYFQLKPNSMTQFYQLNHLFKFYIQTINPRKFPQVSQYIQNQKIKIFVCFKFYQLIFTIASVIILI